MALTISYDPPDSEYSAVVLVEHIVRMYKSSDGEWTLIVLDNGEVLESTNSMKTLQARIDLSVEEA